ncbi:DUF1642 domain-containing protein [Lactiplantibacillus plantarum]|uniref:DUF1642 domain-containing protein n=1 Tax=Lactiplantibacillus plantarum TaxID=1590 RepID=UPI001F33CF0D|nr:DUF1642 domain-containing protein [Lactiplantibacillus plantarum]MCF1423883.1 hypothetical protein [Lactiplantibacillus plantarum]MCG0895012.1 hypothetical protein [Lactiplantibacillus plantarum]
MKKAYRKAATIRAEQFDGSDAMVEKYHIEYDGAYILPFRIETPDGWLGIKAGDWISTGVNGEHWPIADDVFKKTYKGLPVIPKMWANTIEEFKANHYRLDEIFTEWDWNYDEQELIARAWLDGYVVEEGK